LETRLLKQSLAEAIGTFALVFMGCGAVIVHQMFEGAIPSIGIPIVFGGVISVMIYALGHISGAHFNPAVTIAFTVARHLPIRKTFAFIPAQISGATFASYLHKLIFGSIGHSFGNTVNKLSFSTGSFVEIILSFFLMLVIISVATDTRAVGEMAGLAIGTTVGIVGIFGGPLTGASMNPARSIAPAIVSGQIDGLILYIIMPIIGTVLGALIYENIRCESSNKEDHGCC